MPGTASISSGYTSRLQDQAKTCDQARLLMRLQNMGVPGPSFESNKWAPASSVLEEKAAISCGAATDVLILPKKVMTSSAYTKSLENDLMTCSPVYKNRVFPVVCPAIPPVNPALPSVSTRECQPSRFF